MDPKRLSFLLAVARYGSILAAADSLHLTASAVSQQVSRLEKEEGVELLERGPRGVGLTPAGRILVEAAENIERELADARSRLSEAQHGVTGRVVIGAFQTVVSGFLVPILDHLHEALPGLELSIADATSARLPRMLRTGEADLIIVDRDLADTGHTPAHTADVPLLDEPWRLVVPRGSTFDLSGAGLEKLPWLGVAPGGASELPVERAKAALGITPPVVHRYEDFQAALASRSGRARRDAAARADRAAGRARRPGCHRPARARQQAPHHPAPVDETRAGGGHAGRRDRTRPGGRRTGRSRERRLRQRVAEGAGGGGLRRRVAAAETPVTPMAEARIEPSPQREAKADAHSARGRPAGLNENGPPKRAVSICLNQICEYKSCAPGGIRTPNLLIRSQMLYPLSYGRMACSRGVCALQGRR
jgi:DNA-binding transcriptional LysR family regulator